MLGAPGMPLSWAGTLDAGVHAGAADAPRNPDWQRSSERIAEAPALGLSPSSRGAGSEGAGLRLADGATDPSPGRAADHWASPAPETAAAARCEGEVGCGQ